MQNPQFIINPVTHRKVKLGGRMWRNLVKQGILAEETYRDPNVLYTVDRDHYQEEKELKEELYRQKDRLVKENPHKYKKPVVKGNKIILSKNKLTNEETARITANSAIDVIDDIQSNEQDIPANMTRDEARQYLQGLIFDKMIAQKKKFINTKLEPKGKPNPRRLTLQNFNTLNSKPPLIRQRRVRPNSHLKPLKRIPKKQVRYVETQEEEVDSTDYNQTQEEVYYEDEKEYSYNQDYIQEDQ